MSPKRRCRAEADGVPAQDRGALGRQRSQLEEWVVLVKGLRVLAPPPPPPPAGPSGGVGGLQHVSRYVNCHHQLSERMHFRTMICWCAWWMHSFPRVWGQSLMHGGTRQAL